MNVSLGEAVTAHYVDEADGRELLMELLFHKSDERALISPRGFGLALKIYELQGSPVRKQFAIACSASLNPKNVIAPCLNSAVKELYVGVINNLSLLLYPWMNS